MEIYLSWEPPFSFNLTTAEPDIAYCVDVYNITDEQFDHLSSICNVTMSKYNFSQRRLEGSN